MMRVVFIGTSEFGVPSLEAVNREHDVVLVVTQPDRSKGRGRKLSPTPIKEKALDLGLNVIQPERIADAERIIKNASPDVIVLVSYGQIVPKTILDIPKIGSLNIHPSLLPKYRGAAPIQRAIMEGEQKTGVTIIWMNERLDAGDIFLQREVDIRKDETYGELHERLSYLSAELILEALRKIEVGEIIRIPQKDQESSYAPPIKKEETIIDWNKPAFHVVNLIRALSPKPAAVWIHNGRRFKIYKARVSKESGSAGEILVKDIRKGVLKIACSQGSIEVLEIQPEGKKVMDVASFLRGYGDKI